MELDQWVFLTYVVAAEAAIAVLLTHPLPKLFNNFLASLIPSILQQFYFIAPINWMVVEFNYIYSNNQRLLMCASEVCTATERDQYEKSIYEAQRNVILCVAACLLFWCLYFGVSGGGRKSGGNGEKIQGSVAFIEISCCD